MGPINYVQDVRSPLQSALQGVQTGFGLQQAQAQAQMEQLKLQQAQAAQQQQLQMQKALGELGSNPNATFQDYNRIALMLPKDQADSVRSSWEAMNKNQQDSQLQFGGQVFSAVQKDPALAISMLNDRAIAERNAGNEQQAKAYETWAKLAEASPERAAQSMGIMLSQLPGSDKIFTNLGKMGEEQRAQDLHAPAVQTAEAEAFRKTAEAAQTPQRLELEASMNKAQIANYKSQISDRAKQYNLNVAKFEADTDFKLAELRQKAGTLTPTSEKLLNDSTVASQAANANAGNLLSLADKFKMNKGALGSGLFTSLGDRIAKITGDQGQAQQIRQEYTRLRNTNVIASLPPGSASDRDISIMMAGYPPDNASPEHIESFLRGMAKTQRYSAINEGVKAEWVAQNGNLRAAKQDMVINGVIVPAGANYMEFSRSAGQEMYDNIYKAGDNDRTAGQNVQRVSNSPIMGYAGAQLVNE